MNETTEAPKAPLSRREILHFYTPLVLTSQLMTLSGPIVNVAIGRAADPKVEFAGYWIGFTIALFIESTCLVVQQLVLSLLNDRDSLRRLVITAFAIGLSASIMVLAVALTPIGEWVLRDVIPTTGRVADLARNVLIHLSPLPLAVALRGVANGIAISEKRTNVVAAGTLLRIIALSTVVGAAVLLGTGSGAIAASWALISGIVFETAFMIAVTAKSWMARLAIAPLRSAGAEYGEIVRIITPLAVSAFVWTSTRPVIHSILGRLPDPELAQASFGIVFPIVLVTCSPLWALHNVSAVLPHSRSDLWRLIRFSVYLSLLFTAGVAALTWTPLKFVMLRLGFNLSPEMERAVSPALGFIVLEPFFLAARSLAQGLLIKAKRTEALLVIAPIKIVLTAAVGLAAVIWNPDLNGAVLAVLLVVGGDLFDALAYGFSARSLIVRGLVFGEHEPSAGPPLEDPLPPPVGTE